MVDLNKFKDYIKNRENSVHIDINKEFIYFPVNKVMQTSIGHSNLGKRLIKKKKNPELWNELIDEIDLNKIYKFGICRNPIDKFESAYNYLVKMKVIKNNNNINFFIHNTLEKYNNPFLLDPHFEKQYKSFYFENYCLCNDIFKIENIDEGLKILSNKLKIKLDINHLNKTIHKSKINNKSIEILKIIYNDDFLLYK